MDYRASKAWHHSHKLALEVHELVREVVPTDTVANDLAVKMRQASAMAPQQIKDSVDKELAWEKLACYLAARQALEELHEHLKYALKLKYIEKKFFKQLEKMAATAYRELGRLVESTEHSTAQTTE